MKKNDLLKNGEEMIRILDIWNDRILIVPCAHQSLPKWMDRSELSDYQTYDENESPFLLPDIESLPSEQRRIAHERFTQIAGILAFIGDEYERRR